MRTTHQVTISLVLVLLVTHVTPLLISARSQIIDPLCPGLTQKGRLSFFCDDFGAGNDDFWTPEGGNWMVINGSYQGEGTNNTIGPCGFELNQSMVKNLEVRDLDMQLDMKSIQRVDKAILLRSADSRNQIALNIRAERPEAFPADLIVQEIVDCQIMMYTPEFSVLIPPHQVGQTIHVRIRLIGQRLVVWIDQVLVLDREFPFAIRSGKLGVGVIEAGTTAFDNVIVDGVSDDADACPDSDRSATVVIGGCDSEVTNTIFPSGCTLADLLADCADHARKPRKVVRCVARLTHTMKRIGILTDQQKDALQSCAAQADLP